MEIFDGLIGRLNPGKERISELEDISTESSKAKRTKTIKTKNK